MPISKSRSGGAYITVITVTMLILLLAALVLSVTAVSRRLSARYSDYIGLFDLAVAGNEQVFFLLHQTFESQEEDIISRAWQRVKDDNIVGFEYRDGELHLDSFLRTQFRGVFVEEAMSGLVAVLGDMLSRAYFGSSPEYRLYWGLDTTISADEFAITDSYRAVTTLYAATNRFYMDTVIRRYIGNYPGFRTIVQSSIIWTDIGYKEIILDAYTIYALESDGAVFPVIPNNGEKLILFLDGFTPSMVESLRLDTRRRDTWGR